MYFGHFGAALLFSALYPQVDINIFYVGSAWLDFIHAIFIPLGLTVVQPNINSGPYFYADLTYADWDHSLLMAFVLSAFFAYIASAYYYSPCPKDHREKIMTKNQFAIACFSASFFHWLLDLPVHNNDLALYPGSSISFGWSWWARFGAWAWVIEVVLTWSFLAIALFLAGSRNARHMYDQSRYSTILYHGMVIGGVLPIILNPIASPMKFAAQNPNLHNTLVSGLSVGMGYILPISLMNRYLPGYLVDFPDLNSQVQFLAQQRPSPPKYYKGR